VKTISDLLSPESFHKPGDFINGGGALDRDLLAYHLFCNLRSLDQYKSDTVTKSVELIRDYFEAATNAEKGKL